MSSTPRNRRQRRRALMGRLLLTSARDPWVLLVAGLVGGAGWAVGIAPPVDVGLAAVMVGVGAGAVTLSGRAELPTRSAEPRLRPGTEQAELVETLEGYVRDLAELRGSTQPDAIIDPTIEALSAAQASRESAVTVAAAIDSLEDAIARSSQVSQRWAGSTTSEQIGASVRRMTERRDSLRASLSHTVGEIAEVYTELLEVSTSVSTAGLRDGSVVDIDSINASLDSLRTAVAELESDRRRAKNSDVLGELD